VVHLILPCIGFWLALTIVISVLMRHHQKRWPFSMVTAAVLVLVVGSVVAVFGLHNLPLRAGRSHDVMTVQSRDITPSHAFQTPLTNGSEVWKGADMGKAVAYYRVSTAKQGSTGHGLAAQRAAVEELCRTRGLDLIAPPFEEVESGKNADRPELMKALERCKVTGATLVVAKLDRLSRSVAFLAALQDSGAKFIAADMPEANELTVHILAAVAQAERKAISTRTKEALAAAKARGQKLGNPNGAAALRRAGPSKAGTEAIMRNAAQHAERLRPIVKRLQEEGNHSLVALAKALNEASVLTPRGASWHPSSVSNLLYRLAG